MQDEHNASYDELYDHVKNLRKKITSLEAQNSALETDNANHVKYIKELEDELNSLRLSLPSDPHDRYVDEQL
jgi:ribosomal protein L29